MNEYKILGVRSNKLISALRQLDTSHFLGFFKQLKEENVMM